METKEEEKFDLHKMLEMSYTIAEMPEKAKIDIDLLCEYLYSYVLMLKTMGRLVELGFSDIITKSNIIKENREKFIEKGETIDCLEDLLEIEINNGLGQTNGSNNKKLGLGKNSEYYTHIGSCRSAERILRFLLLLQRIIENMLANKDESFGGC